MTHVLRIEPAIPETIRFRIKQFLEDKGYTAHSGHTNPKEPSYNELVFSKGKSDIKEDTGSISDGYHTSDELYEFRKLYNAAFCNALAEEGKHHTHKSTKHHDGDDCFGGDWFIVVAELPTGMISNHYKLKDWDLFQIPTVERSTVPYDGHTAKDVVDRLTAYVKGQY